MCICLACVIDVFLEFLFVFSVSDWEWWRVGTALTMICCLFNETPAPFNPQYQNIKQSITISHNPFGNVVSFLKENIHRQIRKKKLQIQNNVPDPCRKIQSKEKYCSQSNYFLFSSAPPLIQWMHCAKFLHFRCPSF